MKDSFYFSHDYHARHDLKMQNLLFKHKMLGIGIYWSLIEILHEENGYAMRTQCDGIATAFLTTPEILNSVITDFGLFGYDEEKFWSNRVLVGLKKREEKSKAGREAAQRRWVPNANAMPTQCQPNAIKERKGKERKENSAFAPPSLLEIEAYCKERKNTVSPKDWLNHYEAKGWMIGKTKMVNWKAAVRTWERNENENKQDVLSTINRPRL